MALSKAQQVALFNILDIPWVGDVYHFCDPDHLVSLKISISVGDRQTLSLVAQYLSTVVSADVDFETELKTRLDRWLALGTQNWHLTNGAVGSVNNMNMSPAEERQEIERQVQKMVPFYDPNRRLGNASASFNRFMPVIS
jgi:hypothetical protein